MIRKFLLLIVCVIIPSIGTFAQNARKFEQKIGMFDKVKVLDNVNVVYSNLRDSVGYAQYFADEDFEDAFIFKCNDSGTLKIQVASDFIGDPELPTLFIYSDFLTSVENSSSLDLIVEEMAPCPEFKATQIGNGSIIAEDVHATKVNASLNTGNGTVTISGECENAVFKMVGAGVIAADRLKASTVDCRILGTGTIACWPLEKLNVKGIGSTKIYYKGTPVIKKSGGGKLFELPTSEPTSRRTQEETALSDDE